MRAAGCRRGLPASCTPGGASRRGPRAAGCRCRQPGSAGLPARAAAHAGAAVHTMPPCPYLLGPSHVVRCGPRLRSLAVPAALQTGGAPHRPGGASHPERHLRAAGCRCGLPGHPAPPAWWSFAPRPTQGPLRTPAPLKDFRSISKFPLKSARCCKNIKTQDSRLYFGSCGAKTVRSLPAAAAAHPVWKSQNESTFIHTYYSYSII